MFTTLGLFKDIPCPEGQRCPLMKCIFSHGPTNPSPDGHDTRHQVQVPLTPEEVTTISTPPKGRGTHVPAEEPSSSPQSQSSVSINRQPAGQDTSTLSSPASKKLKPTTGAPKPRTLTAVVSPPALQNNTVPSPAKCETPTSAKPGARLPPRNAPRESLNPRMLPKPPSTHAVRMSILKKLHAAMTSLNEKMISDKDSGNQSLALSPEELITMALDEEEKAAKDNPSVYANVIKLRIVRLTKMGKEDWATEVKTHLNERYYKLSPIQSEQQKSTALETGLSVEEEIAVVRKLLTPLEGLENYGYVTKAPTEREIESAIKGVTESKGWEKCERCGGRFQVFPGRREDGSLTTGGSCTHHPGKSLYPPRKKADRIVGSREAYFSCCNEPLGASSGCTKGETHVFKVSEAKRLASVLQFETTPEQPDGEPRPPVCFDCEMGYTTLGLELIRLTAVSWPEGKELLDVLVRPIGEVLDLNSRFSGVYPEHYTKAVPYGSSSSPTARSERTATEEGEIPPAPLQVVDSPAAARSLLFKLLKPDTPLIGHAIDNDLNACRIIHPTIIDTVILFPAAGGLPNRMALRTLARRHLEREIQTGGSLGHDSKEDSIATGDLVRVKVAETWKRLKSKGWVLQQGTLVAPPGATEDDIADWKLGAGAGQKRKTST